MTDSQENNSPSYFNLLVSLLFRSVQNKYRPTYRDIKRREKKKKTIRNKRTKTEIKTMFKIKLESNNENWLLSLLEVLRVES